MSFGTIKNTAAKSRLKTLLRTFLIFASRKLEKDALQQGITRESYDEFCDRVERTICSISQGVIDKTIQSMNGRIADIIRNNGERLKY